MTFLSQPFGLPFSWVSQFERLALYLYWRLWTNIFWRGVISTSPTSLWSGIGRTAHVGTYTTSCIVPDINHGLSFSLDSMFCHSIILIHSTPSLWAHMPSSLILLQISVKGTECLKTKRVILVEIGHNIRNKVKIG